MTGIYLSALLIGIIALVLSAAFGHDHDIPHPDGTIEGPSITNMKVIMAFLAAFGGAGLIGQYYKVGTGMSVLIAIGGGVGLGLVVWQLLNRVYKEQSTSFVSAESLIGRVGTLSVPIEEAGMGEVLIRHPAGMQIYLARLRQGGAPIRAGAPVTVVDIVGEYAIVEPLHNSERVPQ